MLATDFMRLSNQRRFRGGKRISMKTGGSVFTTLGKSPLRYSGPYGEEAGRGLTKVCPTVCLKDMVAEGRYTGFVPLL